MSYVSDLCIIVGLACVTIGVYLLCGLAWCLVFSGLCTVVVGFLLSRLSRTNAEKPNK